MNRNLAELQCREDGGGNDSESWTWIGWQLSIYIHIYIHIYICIYIYMYDMYLIKNNWGCWFGWLMLLFLIRLDILKGWHRGECRSRWHRGCLAKGVTSSKGASQLKVGLCYPYIYIYVIYIYVIYILCYCAIYVYICIYIHRQYKYIYIYIYVYINYMWYIYIHIHFLLSYSICYIYSIQYIYIWSKQTETS